ncbi:MAG: class I SAM-dependent methyltransferase [Blastocatellales bacterium]
MDKWDEICIPVDAETLEDLSSFFGTDPQICQARLDQYRLSEMADAWRQADPKTPEQMRQFYQRTELYIWELSKWHASESYCEYKDRVAWAIKNFPPETYPKVLDFGSGIATASLEFAKAGYQVTLADVPGETLAFARHRFRRRGLPCSIVEVTTDIPDLPSGFDVVISFDVLEHVPNAEGVMRRLVRAIRPGGVTIIAACFDDQGEHPQHLESNITRFSKMPWDWALAGAGLQFISSGVLVKAPAWQAIPRKIRWRLHNSLPFLPWKYFYR